MKKLKPCRGCGGEKGEGASKCYCAQCLADGVPQARAAEHNRRNALRWYYENVEHCAKVRRDYMQDPAHPERKALRDARAKAWNEANPERARAHRQAILLAYRARKAGAFVEWVEPLVVLERDDGVCGICGRDVDPEDFAVDHVVALANGGEHSYANAQAAHPRCNSAKGAREHEPLAAVA